MSVTTTGLICWQRSALPAAGHRFHRAGPWGFPLSEAATASTGTHISAPVQKWNNRTAGGLPSKARLPHYASELSPERRLEGHQWGGPTHRSSNAY